MINFSIVISGIVKWNTRPLGTPLLRGEFFPLNILFAKQDRFSLNCIIFEGFQGIPPLNILIAKQFRYYKTSYQSKRSLRACLLPLNTS